MKHAVSAISKGCALAGVTNVKRHRVDLRSTSQRSFQYDSIAVQTPQHTYLYVCKPSAGSACEDAALSALQLLHRFPVCILVGAKPTHQCTCIAYAASARCMADTMHTRLPLCTAAQPGRRAAGKGCSTAPMTSFAMIS